jgi:pSer/pThr/pTyr-binding forkhead associated (FHA) protein
MIELLIEHVAGPLTGQVARFGASKVRVTIGRDPMCDVAYPEHLTHVGAEHLDLLRDAGHYELRVNSVDAVLVNGERVGDGWELHDGDTVRLGGDDGPAFTVRYENRPVAPTARPNATRLPDDARSLMRLHHRQRLMALLLLLVSAVAIWGFLRAHRAETELRQALDSGKPLLGDGSDARGFAAAIKATAPSVYLVLSKADDVGESPVGTAWVVAPNALATNAHVAEVFHELAEEARGRRLIVRSAADPHHEFDVVAIRIHPAYKPFEQTWQDYAPALIDDMGQVRELDFVPGYDVGLLFVPNGAELGQPLPVATPERLAELQAGESIAFVGFPKENLIESDNTRPNPTSQVANIVALSTFTRTKPMGKDAELIEHSLPITGGASGSPMIDERGIVIGLLSAENAMISPLIGRAPSAALVNYGQRADALYPLLHDTVVDLDGLRKNWRADLGRYQSREKVTDRVVASALKQWQANLDTEEKPAVVERKSYEIDGSEQVRDLAGIRYVAEYDSGHYLAVAVSPTGRDIDASVHAVDEGGGEELIEKDEADDHFPMVPFDIDGHSRVAISVVDGNLAADSGEPSTHVDLTVYRLPRKPAAKADEDAAQPAADDEAQPHAGVSVK